MDFKLRLRLFFRSLLIQAGWNFERMQNVGYAYTIMPVLQKEYKADRFPKALARNLESFNTQPFMAGFTLGMMAKLEEEAAAAAPESLPALEENITSSKQATSTALAAIGDRIFWGTLRPFTVLLVLVVWLLFGIDMWCLSSGGSYWPLLTGIIGAFVFYNAFSLWVRWQGLWWGYECCKGNLCGMDFVNWHKIIRRLRQTGFLMSLMVLAAAVGAYLKNLSGVESCIRLGLSEAAVITSFAGVFVIRKFGFVNIYLYAFIVAASAIFFSFSAG